MKNKVDANVYLVIGEGVEKRGNVTADALRSIYCLKKFWNWWSSEKINQEAQTGYQGEILFLCTHRVKVEKTQWKENSAAAWVKEMCLDGEAVKLKTPSMQ